MKYSSLGEAINRTTKSKLPLFSLVLVFIVLASSQSFAQDTFTVSEVVHSFEADRLQITFPAGLAYVPEGDAFVLLSAEPVGPAYDGYTLYDPAVNEARPLSGGPAIGSPLNMTYDGTRERLLLLDTTTSELVAASLAADQAALSVNNRYSILELGLQQPAGMAVDPATGALFILDSAANNITRITPGSDGSYASAAARNEGRVDVIDLTAIGVTGLRGLAFNPATGHLYVMAPAQLALYEVTSAGQLVKTHDLSGSGLTNPQALVFAPTGDQTDDASLYDLYIADSGSALAAPANPDPSAFPRRLYLPQVSQGTDMSAASADASGADTVRAGQVLEIALDQPAEQFHAAAATTTLTLVRTTQTYKWSPSSPDPDGITYVPSANQLVVADGEVDEISALFAAKQNIFRASLAGVLQGTMSTVIPVSFTKEPTGVSYNPNNRHLFYSDDDKLKIFEVDPGADGVLGTSDDKITSLSVTTFSGRDSEDVNYDLVTPGLWIIDGTNAEVYHLLPGSNGKFDGVPPDGDDILDHFDTKVLGIVDPEGIYRDTVSGNLFLTSKDPTKVWEVSTAGNLVRIYDVSAAKAVKLAGVTLAPNSKSPGDTSIYLVDRVVDNNTNSKENDGLMYEFALRGGSVPTATPTAAPTSTPSATATPVGTATPTPVPGAQLTINPSDDTFVRSDWPNSNYSTNTSLRVVGSPIINSYLKFSVSGLNGAPQSAKLRLYVTDPSTSGGTIYLVSNNYNGTSTAWVESGLNYNNAPPVSGTPLSSLGSVATGTWVEFDVTAAVTGNGTYSFAITSSSTNSVYYNSKDAGSNTPVLVISQ